MRALLTALASGLLPLAGPALAACSLSTPNSCQIGLSGEPFVVANAAEDARG